MEIKRTEASISLRTSIRRLVFSFSTVTPSHTFRLVRPQLLNICKKAATYTQTNKIVLWKFIFTGESGKNMPGL
jgi:hypothetical protein